MTPIMIMPRPVPPQTWRPPQETIPASLSERERLRALIRSYVEARSDELTPPLLIDELKRHADNVVRAAGIDARFRDYAGILVNNEVWRDQLAAGPYDRRLLLLPKWLRVEDK